MNILIFLAVVLVTIVLAIFINRLVRCPLLVGFIFFSIALLVAIILSNLTLVGLALILGIVAFVSAFLDCVFNSSCFFMNHKCMNCHNPYRDDDENNTSNNSVLRIVNENGEVVASINGNSINCYDENPGCGCCGRTESANLLSDSTQVGNTQNTFSSNCRAYKRR